MKKNIRALVLLLLCLLLSTCLVTAVFADMEGGGGDADFGGGDFDGGDYGGYDGGYDGDYGDSSRSYSSGDGEFSGSDAVIIIIFIVVFVVIALRSSKKGGNKRVNTGVSRQAPIPSLRPIQQYKELDPDFDPDALIQKLTNLYIQAQQCWTAKKVDGLRPYYTDAYFAQMERRLQQLKDKGVTNYVDRPTVLGIELSGFTQEGGNDHIYAVIRSRIVDYYVEDATGKVVSGSKTAEKFMTYRYHLIRPTGTMSSRIVGTRALSCPHCGAPLNINQSAKCPYCDSVITVEEHDFVISQIEALSQQTVQR